MANSLYETGKEEKEYSFYRERNIVSLDAAQT